MDLSEKEILERVKAPIKSNLIHEAALNEQRIKFHTEPIVNRKKFSVPATIFLDWVKLLLPKDKYNTFLQLFKLPIDTTSIVESAYKELAKVFKSKNSSFEYEFDSNETLDDWLQYRKNALNCPGVWINTAWKQMQIHINSFIVVDMPEKQNGTPEPYFYWLDILNVIDYELSGYDTVEWIIFNQPNDRIAVIDGSAYRIYRKERVNDEIRITKEREAYHNLGYCPVAFFWHNAVDFDVPDIKKSPITKELSNLDWYLFFSISKRHLDLYAPYPIYSAYEADCNFENNETGDYCDGGFLRDSDGNYKMLRDGSIEPCPRCSSKRIVGPGSFLEVPIPNAADGVADLRDPIQITTIDADSLKYNVSEKERLGQEIIDNIIGVGGSVGSIEALNEMQIAANYDSRTAVLVALKTEFEQAQKFVEKTICKLRYGDKFKSLNIDWGTDFYIFTAKDLYKQLKEAKDSGSPIYEQGILIKQLLEVNHKHSPLSLAKAVILDRLEPYSTLSVADVMGLSQRNFVNNKYLVLKLNFNQIVDEFEDANGDILQCLQSKSWTLDTIKTELLKLSEKYYEVQDRTGAEQTQPEVVVE